jgi:hypothetical protein
MALIVTPSLHRVSKHSQATTQPSNEPAGSGLEKKRHFILRVRRSIVRLTDEAPFE